MASPAVGQLGVLADLFEDALLLVEPESVCVLGVAGGNGLDRVRPSVTRRIVGVDIHPGYLNEARRRCPEAELHVADLASARLEMEPVDLVHAALVFEHAGVGLCLDNAVALTRRALSVVLQLASESSAGVGASPFASLQALQAEFRLIEPEWLCHELACRGFRLSHQERRALPAGKSFWFGVFVR